VGLRGRLLARPGRREELETAYLIRSAEDVTRELGQMKGVAMKAGQLLSFLLDGLPPEARAALEQLQADAPPMAPELARRVVAEDLGAPPEQLFADWSEMPVAAASIGQVHRAVLPDGRLVAVKVQYPGVADALGADLGNVELLYGAVRMLALPNLDTRAVVDELRERLGGELDYVAEARWQAWFAERYRDHPFLRVPDVVPERCGRRVLTTEWAGGFGWQELLERRDERLHQRVAEAVFRFVQGSIYRLGTMQGDPHPGNYRFHRDGSVTVLDFGLVKRWEPGELETLLPLIDPLLAQDPAATVAAMERSRFLAPGHGLDPEAVYAYVSQPYLPYLEEEYRFEPGFASGALAGLLDVGGPHRPVMERLTMPPSFVVLDRVVWGMSALLGRLHATNRWRAILEEYRFDRPPATALGELEERWRRSRPGPQPPPP
jgi:predicted unusual protein kinase regulating ubiquinone biosynthesis (AarF/ABC1/UbiB family)